MDGSSYIPRQLEAQLQRALQRGKSVLLLGPRQTGKTTMLERIDADLRLSLVEPRERQRYERDPGQLAGEVEALRPADGRRTPLVIIDEVQKVPELLDVVQAAIDRRRARFVLCGSSARRLRHRGANLLPGRVVTLRLDPLSVAELPAPVAIDDLLAFGSLPGIRAVADPTDRERDLDSYVRIYLEEEVRAEALVRRLGTFVRFLELAALESGKHVSFRAMSQEIGVSHTTVSGYFEILEDCLVAERVDPLTRSRTRKKLMRSSKWLVFDMGVRRLAAREAASIDATRMGDRFEQFVGLELIRLARADSAAARVSFWRDLDGPEVDWIYARGRSLTPVEVKWTERPTARDARHVAVFLDEYREAERGFVVCRSPRRVRLHDRITALPWQELPAIAEERA